MTRQMDETVPPTPPEHAFLATGGRMAELIRAHDWAATSLGAIESWPASLKTATGMLVASPVPIVMLWGPEGIMIYNDAYSGFAGGRHPRLLGAKVREGWPEVAEFNDNVMQACLAGGTLSYRDQELTLHRNGRPEQVWMNLDYSPLTDGSGQPGGVLSIVIETTERVKAELALRKERDRRRGVLDGMAEGFALFDRAFRVLDINAEGLSLEIRPRDEILGRSHWDL